MGNKKKPGNIGRPVKKAKSNKNIVPSRQITVMTPEGIKTYTLNEIQERFIKKIGIPVYIYGRSQHYGVYGATIAERLAAQEVGYNDSASINKSDRRHNYFGDMRRDGSTLQTFNSEEEGIGYQLQKDTGMLHRLYPTVDAYLKNDSATGSQAQVDSVFRKYNHDPNGLNYITWLQNRDKGVTGRTIGVIKDELADIDTQEAPYSNELETYAKSPFPLIPKQVEDEDKKALTELENKKSDLQHMLQELETGKADSNYLSTPKAFGFPKKNSTPSSSSAPTTSSTIAPPFTSDIAGNPAPPYMGGMGGNGNNDFSNLFNLGDYMNRQSTGSPALQSGNSAGEEMPALKVMGGKHNSTGHSAGRHGGVHNAAPHSAGGHGAMHHPLAHPSKAPATGSLAHPAEGKNAANNGGGGSGVGFHIQNMMTNKLAHTSAAKQGNDMNSQVLAVLQAAIGDSKIGIDIC
jgi:hypothetical protein